MPWDGKNRKGNTKLTSPMALPSGSPFLLEECGAGGAAQSFTKSLVQVEICRYYGLAIHCKSILKYEAK